MENPVENILGTTEIEKKVYILDITDGFPVENAQGFRNLLKHLFKEYNQINRFPIIATKDGHVYTHLDLTDNPRQQHIDLLKALGVLETDVAWTTSVDNVPPNDPATRYIQLDLGNDIVKKLTVSNGGDIVAAKNIPGLVGNGPDKMKEIFSNIPGVSAHW